jgi:hypothetical protein
MPIMTIHLKSCHAHICVQETRIFKFDGCDSDMLHLGLLGL